MMLLKSNLWWMEHARSDLPTVVLHLGTLPITRITPENGMSTNLAIPVVFSIIHVGQRHHVRLQARALG